MYTEYDEDEMMQLASEMSLYDVAENLSHKWNETDFQETRHAIDSVKGILATVLKECAKSREKVISPNSDDKDPLEYAFEAPRPMLPSMIRDSTLPLPEPSPRTPCLIRRRSYNGDLSIRTVQELSSTFSKLRYFQRKLSQAIEYSPTEVSVEVCVMCSVI
jgi:hypothetical protein